MTTLLRFTERRRDTVLGLALFAVALLLYVQTMAPTVAAIYDDSLEFPLVVHRLAIAHPTGYPLYILLGKLFSLIPVGDVAYRLHLLSAVCAAGAAAALYTAARRFGLHTLGALAAGLCLMTSPVFWSQALIAEVYALNALFVALLLALAAGFGDGRRRFGVLAAFVFTLGLALTHHRTVLLIAPALAVYLALAWRAPATEQTPWPRRWPFILLALLFLPFLLYLYLPLRGAATSSLDGSYQNTLSGFVSWVTASTYTAFLSGNPLQQPALDAAAYGRAFAQQFGSWGLALAALGGLALLLHPMRSRPKDQRPWRLLTLIVLSGVSVLAFVLAYRVADWQVFLVPAFMMVALAIGAGVNAIAGWAVEHASTTDAADQATAQAPERPSAQAAGAGQPWFSASGISRHASRIPHLASRILRPVRRWARPGSGLRLATATLVAAIVPALTLLANANQLDRSHDWAVHAYAVDVLSQPLPPNATIVGILGEMTLLRYYQETAAMQPHVETQAADTDDQRMAAVQRLVQAGRAVYLTRPLAGLDKSYSLSAVGPLIQVRPPATTPAPSAVGQVVFGGRVTLVSYRLTGLPGLLQQQAFPQEERPGEVEAGGRLRLELSWRINQPMQEDYHVTVRLRTSAGRLLWQSDGQPVHSGYSTQSWRVGETVTDVYDLLAPIGTPPGLYDLDIGLYNRETQQLLTVGSTRPGAGAAGQQFLTIGPVSVVRPRRPIHPQVLPRQSRGSALSGAPQGLTIPGGSFDYSLQQLGIQAVSRSNLQNEFTLYGFGVSTRTLKPGQSVDVALLWQAARAPAGDRVVFVQLVDDEGEVWASQESQPGDGAYPTGQWLRDEVVRDVHTLLIPAGLPDGVYHVVTGMYDPSGAPLTVIRLTRRSLDHVDLGAVEVRGRAHSQEIPAAMQYTIGARLGTLAKLVGYEAAVGGLPPLLPNTGGGTPTVSPNTGGTSVLRAQPGDSVHIRLVWQAMEAERTSYTVFVHLLGPNGKVESQDDAIPGRGTLPTSSWVRGEVLLDTYVLPVPASALAGAYSIELGLYDSVTDKRLPVWDGRGASVGDSLALPTKVQVDRAP